MSVFSWHKNSLLWLFHYTIGGFFCHCPFFLVRFKDTPVFVIGFDRLTHMKSHTYFSISFQIRGIEVVMRCFIQSPDWISWWRVFFRWRLLRQHFRTGWRMMWYLWKWQRSDFRTDFPSRMFLRFLCGNRRR